MLGVARSAATCKGCCVPPRYLSLLPETSWARHVPSSVRERAYKRFGTQMYHSHLYLALAITAIRYLSCRCSRAPRSLLLQDSKSHSGFSERRSKQRRADPLHQHLAASSMDGAVLCAWRLELHGPWPCAVTCKYKVSNRLTVVE